MTIAGQSLVGSRSDLLSTSRRRCPPLLLLCAANGATTVSRKLQLEGEPRSEASSTPKMMSACSNLGRNEAMAVQEGTVGAELTPTK